MKITIEQQGKETRWLSIVDQGHLQIAVAEYIKKLCDANIGGLDSLIQVHFAVAVKCGVARYQLEAYGERLHKAGCNIADLGDIEY